MTHDCGSELKKSACVFFAGIAGALISLGLPAHAAPLNLTSATPVVLASRSTTLTIASGSVADSLTVNATSVVVGLSASTGGSFTLLSPSYHLDVATSSTGGTVTYACVSTGTSTLVLAQSTGSTTYTISPTNAACPRTPTSSSSAPAVSTGGTYPPSSFLINRGASLTASPTVTLTFAAPPTVASFAITITHDAENVTVTSSYASTLPLDLCAGLASCMAGTYLLSVDFLDSTDAFLTSSSQSIAYMGSGLVIPSTSSPSASSTGTVTTAASSTFVAELEALLTQLEAELQLLLKEAAAQGITINGVPSSGATVSPYVFTRNLSLWDEGKDVNALQRYLVAENKGPAAEALACHGTTDTFGSLTFTALKEFQKVVGIAPHSGYFGPITRGYIQAHGE